ncbi:hypothetical protein AC578_963 [Pseudocercospora eumusae]|uniref:Dienelactone hydrolase domain-containing protein n=1 Tax=Pseudocercospora eumusae TaxID=321146 RepID=A0A139HEK2_9PEZI|nr:hypothetical protein AC578_963 [Pseudocercospora eumusae]
MHLTLNKRLASFIREYPTPAIESDNPFIEGDQPPTLDHHLTISPIDIDIDIDQSLTASPIDIDNDNDIEMSNTGTHDSAACCTIPTPKSYPDYTPKGTYKTLANTKTYIVGPPTATKAIFFLYDIFGYKTPTLQGADILASSGDYLVAMPDFFDDGTAEVEWLAQDTEEKKEKLGAFLQKIQNTPHYLNRMNESLAALKTEYPTVERWGAIGYCWAGKIVAVTSGENSPWKVGIQTSPAMLEPEDAKKVTVPMLVLASKDEPKDKTQAFAEELKVAEKKVEIFESSIHGWMSGRADLEKEESKKEYERGYEVALEFLKKHL